MKKILLSIGFIFLIGLFPEQLFARELSRSEIDRSSFDYKSLITKVILIENDNERQRMLIEIKFHLSLHKYYSARIENRYSSVDGEYFVVYDRGYRILIAIGSSTFVIELYNSQGNISGISDIGENTYDKIVESIEMFEFINLVPTPEREPIPIYGIDPADIIPGIVPRLEQDGFEYAVVDGRSVTITAYTGNATTLNIPAQIQGLPVTAIGKEAFYYCMSLTSITIPSSVTSIGDWAFSGCMSLISITIPSSVTSISDYAFDSCISLTSVTIPSSVTSIGNQAFHYCGSLTSITIPSSVTSIGRHAFSFCNSLTNITVDSLNPAYTSIDGILFDKSIRAIIAYPAGKIARTYTIPSSVTSIGNDAFAGCSRLTSVTITSSVTYIGDYAFSYCSNLTSVTIPSSVTSIGYGALLGCDNLTSVTLSRHTSVGENAFPETARIIYRD